MRSMARVGAVALLAISLATRPPELPLALAAEVLAGGGVLDRLRVSAEQRRRLAGGEVVSYAVDESSERELAVGLVLFVPAPVSELAQYLEAGRLVADDPRL